MADQFPLPPGATAATPSDNQQFALPEGATPAGQSWLGRLADAVWPERPVPTNIGNPSSGEAGQTDLLGRPARGASTVPLGQAGEAAEGIGQGVQGVVSQPVAHPVDTAIGLLKQTPGADLLTMTAHALRAYEDARSSGGSVTESVKAAATAVKEQDDYTKLAKQVAAHPTREGAAQLTQLGLLYLGGKAVGIATEPTPASAPEVEAPVGAPGILRPGVKTIADTNIPVRAATVNTGLKGAVSRAAESAADTKALREFDVTKTQPAAREAIGNVATQARDAALDDLGAGKLDTVDSFQEAGQSLKDVAKPIYQKLDELTKNEPDTFSDLQKQESTAYRQKDFETVNEVQQKMSDLKAKYADQFQPGEIDRADTLYSKGTAMNKIQKSVINGSVSRTPVEFATEGQPDPGYIRGGSLAERIRKADSNGLFNKAGLTDEHVQALQDLATTLEKGTVKYDPSFNALIKTIAKKSVGGGIGGTVGGLVGGPVGAFVGTGVGALAEWGGEYLVSKGLGKILTSVPATRTLAAGLAAGVDINELSDKVTDAIKNGNTTTDFHMGVGGPKPNVEQTVGLPENTTIAKTPETASGVAPEAAVKPIATRSEIESGTQKIPDPVADKQRLARGNEILDYKRDLGNKMFDLQNGDGPGPTFKPRTELDSVLNEVPGRPSVRSPENPITGEQIDLPLHYNQASLEKLVHKYVMGYQETGGAYGPMFLDHDYFPEKGTVEIGSVAKKAILEEQNAIDRQTADWTEDCYRTILKARETRAAAEASKKLTGEALKAAHSRGGKVQPLESKILGGQQSAKTRWGPKSD
jgi:hypothetical protein